jgi:radical SAM protein with 4Fe4S-binding SPASM domain
MAETEIGRVYRKHNSFVELRRQGGDSEPGIFGRIATVCKNTKFTTNLPPPHSVILAKVLEDLLLDFGDSASPKFRLTPNVIKELDSLSDEELPRYLVHRYRYELFPEQHILDAYPPYLQIEPTSVCNYRCVFCYETDPSFTKKSAGFMGHMSLDTFKKIIDQAEGNVEFISLASRGEPLLCPDIESMLAYTRGKFLNLKMNTNASLLDEKRCHAILQSGIKSLVFSADAADKNLYSKLRVGGSLDKVLANIRRFFEIKVNHYRDSKIITRVSGVKYSDEQDIDAMESFWGGLVDQVAFVAYNPWENTYKSPPSGISTPCSDLWRRMFVWWDGRINPCDVDYKSTLAVGHLQQSNLSTLWASEPYQMLRERHLSLRRGDVEPCRRCSVT